MKSRNFLFVTGFLAMTLQSNSAWATPAPTPPTISNLAFSQTSVKAGGTVTATFQVAKGTNPLQTAFLTCPYTGSNSMMSPYIQCSVNQPTLANGGKLSCNLNIPATAYTQKISCTATAADTTGGSGFLPNSGASFQIQ